MADIVAAEQVVRRVVRLEVGHQRPLDALVEKSFVAVDKTVRFALRPQVQDGPAHGVQGVGSQDVVVVRQSKIFPAGKGGSSVGIGCNALVFDLFVSDMLILCLIFPHDLPDTAVSGIGSIGKAELPVGGGLVHERIQKLPHAILVVV